MALSVETGVPRVYLERDWGYSRYGECYRVMADRPGESERIVGIVCKKPGGEGWTYFSYPSIQTERGPKRTKAAAVLEVMRSYKSWIGFEAYGFGKKRQKHQRRTRGW